LKFEKEKEHKLVGQEMFFLDRFVIPIDGCIEYDTSTGIAIVYEPLDGPGGSSPIIKREKFHPKATPIVDGIAHPDDTQMGEIRQKKTGKRERERS
jgi:hypothetical protein